MKTFKVSVGSTFAEWNRYSVYMTAVCFDTAGGVADYVSCEDKAGVLETPPCDHADIYLYVIARKFPASDVISDSPPFDIEVVVTTGSDSGSAPRLSAKTFSVNQWGGLSAKFGLE